MGEPQEMQRARLSIDAEAAKATVTAAHRVLAQLAGGRHNNPAYVALVEAARNLHMEIARAEFEAQLALPRSGAEEGA